MSDEPDLLRDAVVLVEVVGMILDKLKAYGFQALSLALLVLLAAQTWRLHSEQLAHSQTRIALASEIASAAAANAEAVKKVLAEQQAINRTYEEAVNEARKQTVVAQRNERAARLESDSLRQQAADAARKLADSATPDATVREYAAAVNGLFDQCQRNYQDMAAKAQGHADDVRMILAAWPTTAPGAER